MITRLNKQINILNNFLCVIPGVFKSDISCEGLNCGNRNLTIGGKDCETVVYNLFIYVKTSLSRI